MEIEVPPAGLLKPGKAKKKRRSLAPNQMISAFDADKSVIAPDDDDEQLFLASSSQQSSSSSSTSTNNNNNNGRKSLGVATTPASTNASRRKSLRFGANLGSPESKEEKTRVTDVLNVYEAVAKLVTENKVTTKNSWSLNLIENIETVLYAAKGSFHKASCALSAAVEIYGQRVDGTHEDTFKMLDTVLSSEKRGEADGEENRERRKMGNAAGPTQAANTLESNLANIQLAKTEKEFDLDPLFRKILMTFAANEGGAKGMLLNTLTVHDGCTVVFDTCDVVAFPSPASAASPSSLLDNNNSNDDEEGEEGEKLARERATKKTLAAALSLIPPPNAKRSLCSSLEELRKGGGAILTASNGGKTSSDSAPPAATPLDVDPIAGEEPEYFEEAYYDDDFGENSDDRFDSRNAPDFSTTGGGAEDDEAGGLGMRSFFPSSSSSSTPSSSSSNGSLDPLAAVEARLLSQGGTFSATSYFDPAVLSRAFASASRGRFWAGPAHWKLATVNNSSTSGNARGSGTASAGGSSSSTPGERRAKRLVDFFAAPVPASAFEAPPRSQSSTLMTLDPTARHVLPRNVHFDVADLASLFNRPGVSLLGGGATVAVSGLPVLRLGGSAPGEKVWEDGPSLEGDASAMGGFDEDDDEDDGSARGSSVPVGPVMVAPAHHVERIRLAFATRAKKVDVKKLKADLWETVSRDMAAIRPEERNEEGLLLTKTIEEMTPDVDASSAITVPFYFICMLHLCNEMGIELASSEGLDDLLIKGR